MRSGRRLRNGRSIFWTFAGPPHFPFLLVLGTSMAFGLMLAAYQTLLRLLSR